METKDDKSLTTIDKINVKLVLGSSPAHESRVLDISEALPKEIIGEINAEMKEYECSDPTLLGATARIIGAIETFYDVNGKTEQSFLPLMNPFGAFVSLQQGVHRILRGAIVNQKQLYALLESVDELFDNVEKEHQQGLKYVYKEKGL